MAMKPSKKIDLKYYGGAFVTHGQNYLIKELVKLEDCHGDEISQLLVFLSVLGGTDWPSILVEKGASLDAVDDEGSTVLSQCIHGSCPYDQDGNTRHTFETAMELLRLGASPNLTYQNRTSVTSLAVGLNKPEFATLFLACGADLNLMEPESGKRLSEVLEHSEHQWAKFLLKVFGNHQPHDV